MLWPQESLYGCNLLTRRVSQNGVVTAASEDTCEHRSPSRTHKLPGMQTQIKSV